MCLLYSFFPLMTELIAIDLIYFRKSFPSQHATLASFAAVYVSVSKSQSFRSIQALSIHCVVRDRQKMELLSCHLLCKTDPDVWIKGQQLSTVICAATSRCLHAVQWSLSKQRNGVLAPLSRVCVCFCVFVCNGPFEGRNTFKSLHFSLFSSCRELCAHYIS